MDIIAVLTDSIEGARAARSIEPRDPLSTSALRWEVYRALQSLLDALAMLTADLGLRKPPSYGALGRPLAERGVLTGEEAEAVAFIACIRNLLAHAYRRISVGELLEVREELLRKVEALAVKLMEYVRSQGLDPPAPTWPALEEVLRSWRVKVAYLFGSRARGTWGEGSDYDLAVVMGRRVGPREVGAMAADLAGALGTTPDMVDLAVLDDADPALVYRVLKEGMLVYYEDERTRRVWERRLLFRVLDAGDLMEVYLPRLMKRLR